MKKILESILLRFGYVPGSQLYEAQATARAASEELIGARRFLVTIDGRRNEAVEELRLANACVSRLSHRAQQLVEEVELLTFERDQALIRAHRAEGDAGAFQNQARAAEHRAELAETANWVWSKTAA